MRSALPPLPSGGEGWGEGARETGTAKDALSSQRLERHFWHPALAPAHAPHELHHRAALHLLHHLLHLLELVEQAVDLLDLHAGTGGDAALAGRLDDLGLAALLGGHGA